MTIKSFLCAILFILIIFVAIVNISSHAVGPDSVVCSDSNQTPNHPGGFQSGPGPHSLILVNNEQSWVPGGTIKVQINDPAASIYFNGFMITARDESNKIVGSWHMDTIGPATASYSTSL